jgi:hypothetical protein
VVAELRLRATGRRRRGPAYPVSWIINHAMNQHQTIFPDGADAIGDWATR